MYRFTARSSAPIQYLDTDAKRLLKIIGKEDARQGIVTKAQLQAALEALERAVAQDEAMPQAAAQPVDTDGQEEDESGRSPGQGVPLRHRALPLMQLLRAASAADEDIVWEA